MDSFKKLLDEEAEELIVPEQTLRDIEKRVHFSTQPVRFVMSTVDLFLPKAVNAFMAIIGSRNSRKIVRPTSPNHQIDPINGGF